MRLKVDFWWVWMPKWWFFQTSFEDQTINCKQLPKVQKHTKHTIVSTSWNYIRDVSSYRVRQSATLPYKSRLRGGYPRQHPRGAQEGQEAPQRRPRAPQVRTRGAQEAPKRCPRAPKWSRQWPKRAPDAPKSHRTPPKIEPRELPKRDWEGFLEVLEGCVRDTWFCKWIFDMFSRF